MIFPYPNIESWVYFLKFEKEENGKKGTYFKIGFTTKLIDRMNTLRREHSRLAKMTVIHGFLATRETESFLHRKFQHLKIVGDYYLDFTGELEEFFKKHKEEYLTGISND